MKNTKKHRRQKEYTNNSHGKAALFTLGFCFVFLAVEIGYKIKVERQICTWEVIMIFLMLSVYGIVQKLFSRADVPTNLRGEPLPTGKLKKDKRRRKSFYALNALIYSLMIAAAIILIFVTSSDINNINLGNEMFFDTDMSNFTFGLILSGSLFPIAFIVSFMVEYVWYEYRIAQYNLITIIRAEAAENAKATEEATEIAQPTAEEKEAVEEAVEEAEQSKEQ